MLLIKLLECRGAPLKGETQASVLEGAKYIS